MRGIAKWLRRWFLISIFKGSNPFTPKMNSYYGRLIKKNNLKNFWCFSGNSFKNIFPINYKFIFCFYKKTIFFDLVFFISIVRKIAPILNSIINNKGEFLFVGTKSIYCQTVYRNKVDFIPKLLESNVGIFTNFKLNGFKSFKNFRVFKNPSIILFYQILDSNFLLVEAKKKNIPVVGLLESNSKSHLIDYPIFLNSFYFYNIYIFSRFFFNYIIKLI
jgi:ribosomal protein S2